MSQERQDLVWVTPRNSAQTVFSFWGVGEHLSLSVLSNYRNRGHILLEHSTGTGQGLR